MLIRKASKLLQFMMPVIATMTAATIANAREESISTVRYSKEELAATAKPNFIRSRDLSDVLSEKLSLIAVTLTQRQGGSNVKLVEMANASAQPTHEQHMKRLGTMVYDPNTERTPVDGDALRMHLAGQTRKSFEVKFKEAVPLIDEIRKGVNFKFSLFDRKNTPSATSAPVPEIRYGLVVSDIEPSAAPALASLSSPNELEYATPARVVYTIDRIDEPSSRRVFSDFSTTSNTAPLTTRPTSINAWKKPSTDVDVKIEAANSDDTVSDKVTGGALPGAKVTMSQADGLLATQVITNSRFGKDSMTHEVKLPIIGEANISRKVDERMKPIQTSLNNVLVLSSAPKLNLFYLNAEERYKGELLVHRTNFDMGIVAEPRKGWGPGQKTGSTGDKISLTLNQNF